MTTIVSVLVLLLAGVIVLFAILGLVSRKGEPPGLVDGHLAPCPDSPNCVSSEAPPGARHHVEPLAAKEGGVTASLAVLDDVIHAMGGRVGVREDDYLAAEFSSALFGFVDDLEVRGDEARGVIHLRSASRVGYSDGGVNRARVAALRARYEGRMKAPERNP